MKKYYQFLTGTAQFKALAVLSALALLIIASCNKEVDDDFGTGSSAYKLEKPTACPIAGPVAPGTEIRLYNAMDPDAAIYYTTDESDPTADSTLFDNDAKPVITGEDGDVITIKAYSVKPGMEDSIAAIFEYTVNKSAPADYFLTFIFVAGIDDNTPVTGAVTPQYTTGDTTNNQLEYSTDLGETWTAIASGSPTPDAQKILFRGSGRQGLFEAMEPTNAWTIATSGMTRVTGNINTVLDYENPPLSVNDYAFCAMFFYCTSLIEAPDLPAASVGPYGYAAMFMYCDALIAAPELPATTIGDYCYFNMFNSCTSLREAPARLPAATLAEACYYSMFLYCEALETPPELPATTLADNCYYNMFTSCTNLQTAPELPAANLAEACYDAMFQYCESLEEAPELLAANLTSFCYANMFEHCISLKTAPELPATALADRCYYYMFSGCTLLQTAPELPALTLLKECYYSMFEGCTSLSEIKCNATDIDAEDCVNNWTSNVAQTGTFYKNPSMETWPTNSPNGIPTNWDIQPLPQP